MALLDALLLDPAPFNVWIAARTDGILGSGTATDPYNGTPTVRIDALSRIDSTVFAELAVGHGLQKGDSVVISGVTGAEAHLWNGIFTISDVAPTFFRYTTMSAPPNELIVDGAIVAAKVADIRFDEIMNALPANTRVHLGPGTFLTRGHAANVSGGWQIKPGMKIVGSGIDITTLQLYHHTAAGYYFAIGHALGAGTRADLAEVSDLTIDCNLSGAGASTAGSAVRLMGNHTRLYRVKAVNWGSHSGGLPCSALSCITALPDSGVLEILNTGMEGCIVVSPGTGNEAACTALNAGNPDDVSFIADGHGKSPYIRNCFVDCGVATPNPNPATGKYRGVAMGWCRGGVVEGNHFHNCDLGGPYQEGKSSARDVIVRNNFYKNVGRGPYWNLGAPGLERAQGSPSLSRSGTVGTVTNLTTFGDFDAGVCVKLVTAAPGDFTGVYAIQSKTATSMTVTVPESGPSSINVTSARKIFGLSRAIVEGNVIELAQVSGAVAIAVADNNDSNPYVETPDYVHGGVIVRNNKIRYVNGAVPNDGGATLIDLRGMKHLIVQNNVLDTVATLPIQATRCGTQTYFDNRTVAGALIAVTGFTAADFYETLERPAEDAFVVAHFSKH